MNCGGHVSDQESWWVDTLPPHQSNQGSDSGGRDRKVKGLRGETLNYCMKPLRLRAKSMGDEEEETAKGK